jgi:enoyl-[acyl-carrier-protein] reductase (NADH)
MVETLNARFRLIVTYAIMAVAIAALLRHTVHVYGGYSREEIRAGALMAVPMVVTLLAFLQSRDQG